MENEQTEINVIEVPYGLVAYLPPPDNHTFLYAAIIRKKDLPESAHLLRAGTASGFTYDHALFFYLEDFEKRYESGDWVGHAKERTKPPHTDAVLDESGWIIFKKGSLEARAFEDLSERVPKSQRKYRTGR